MHKMSAWKKDALLSMDSMIGNIPIVETLDAEHISAVFGKICTLEREYMLVKTLEDGFQCIDHRDRFCKLYESLLLFIHEKDLSKQQRIRLEKEKEEHEKEKCRKSMDQVTRAVRDRGRALEDEKWYREVMVPGFFGRKIS